MAGVSLNNRKLATNVRTKLLLQCQAILDGDDEQAKKELLMKMCTTLLPRLNEHTGEDGDKLFPKPLLGGQSNGISDHNSIKKTAGTKETD